MPRRTLAWMLPLLLAGCGRGCETARPTARPTAPPAALARERAAVPPPAPSSPAPSAEAPAAPATGSSAAPGPRSMPSGWRFDASDQQMQQVIQYALDTTGCRMDQPECPGLAQALHDGGDRLGSYLLDQYRRAGPDHPAAQALLDLAAATRSQNALAYLEDQLTHPDRAGPAGTAQAANALRNAPEATTMGIVLRAWGAAPDDSVRTALVDAWERSALVLPDRKQAGIQGLRMLSTNPAISPELRGHIVAAQMCLELGTGCPTP